MADFEMPEDIARLSDDELETNLAAAVRSFGSLAKSPSVTTKDIDTLKSLKASIQAIKDEQASRTAAAEAAAAEIDALTAEVFGDETGTEDEAEAEVVEPTAEAEVVEPTAVVTAAGRRALNLSAVRAKQNGGNGGLSRYLPSDEPGAIELTAAVDVPGFRPGQQVELNDLVDAVIRRAQSLNTSGGGTGMIASYVLPFPASMQINDASSAPEGSLATIKAADQRRLEGGVLTASGGWCAPSETLYSFTERACPDMLWDLPEVQINRGGIRFFREPVLDVAALTWVHTEQNDIAGNTKPCFVIPCATPIDVRAQAVGICLQYGILTARYFPELIDLYTRQAMVAHEIRVKTDAYNQARAAATPVTTTASFAAFSAVFGAIALQVADFIERLHLCDGTAVEIVLPWWAKNLFLADIARRQGVPISELRASLIEDAFAELGARVQWVRGLAPDVPTNIGGATAATGWPADLEFLMYEAGAFQLGRGPQIDLGVIVDSTTVSTNDAKFFSEEATLLIDRAGTARRVTVTICPNGAVGAQTVLACPTA